MVWYTNQSLLLILLAFLLGLLVGYLWWGLRLRRVRSSESVTESTTAAPPARAVSSESSAPPASAAPIAAAVADSEPLAEPAPSPVPAEPAPVAQPEPVAAFESEPVAAVEAEPAPVVVTEDPAADDLVADEPIAEEPVAEEPVTADEPVAAEEPEAVDADLVADVESAFAAPSEAAPQDRLERIEGIGPKIAAALRSAGISTYEQLAAADRSTVEDALERGNLRFAPSIGTWSQQARLLADGDEAGFKALTDRLIAGREVTAKTAPVVDETEAVVEEPVPAAVVVEEPAPASVIAEEPLAAEPVVDEPFPAESVVEEPAPVVEESVVEEPVAAEPEPAVEEPVAAEPEPAVEEPVVEPEPVVAVPAQAAPVEDVKPDNLQRIEGIGPKMSGALIASGIRTYRQLADADVDTLRTAIEAAGLRFAPSIVTWARQAAHLADGDEEGFADLTRRLVAGRDTGRA
ncbi:helix-hairpin-helix domain-containing protein [Dactylosporangium sp. CS-047395]|uniref:helix-hairpin-helix domain-containing protein n=1 Tax=Dactylosporangium sp. CS-047395 TaxID=3239936 RepID=UPI003D929ADC